MDVKFHEPIDQFLQPLVAEFTRFEVRTNWYYGKVGKFSFEAKVFDIESRSCINGDIVSVLFIYNGNTQNFESCVVYYDQGWTIKPTDDIKPYFDAVMELLENAHTNYF